MQQCHGKDKATTSAIPYHAKGKTAVSVMPCHGKDKAATSAMRPKHVFTDDDIVQEHIPPSDRIRQRGLNRDTCSMPPFRPKEMADTRSSCVVPRKHLGKEGSLSPGMGLRGEMLQKGREKVHTGPIPQKHNAKEKMTPPDQLRGCTQGINQPFKTESTLAGEMSQKRTETPQEHSTKEKACPPDQLRGCMQGIKRPVKTESPLAGEMSQKRTETPQKHSTKEKACPPDQLHGRMQGIKRPVKTESPLAGEMSQKRTETPQKHSTKEKTCPRDQLRGHTHGIKQPVKTEARISHKPMEKVDTGPIPQKHNAMEKMCPPDQLRRQMQGIKRPVKTEAHIFQKQREKVDTGSIPQKLNAMEKTCPPDQLRRQTEGIKRPVKTEARMSQKQREKADTSLIPQKHNAMEKTCPPDQLRHRTQGIQRPVKTEARLAGEKKHMKSNTSFPTKRTTPQLRTRTSSRCSNACTSRPIDAHDHGNTAAIQKQREKSARIKVDEDVEEIIQKLNKLGLGEDISFEEYYGYLEQLPLDPRVDTSNKLDLMGRFHMDLRHAVYRIRSYKLLNKESKNELCRHELKECPMDLLDKDEFPKDFLVEMQYFRFFQKKGVLDWFFDPDLPAGLNDYQRLVPHDHGHGEYAFWGAYRSYFHSYEMQLEYIKYFETLLRELEWLKDCLPRKFSSRTVNKIRTRGIYQATKIATRFSNITPHLARIGFDDCFTYMSFEATWCNGSDDLYFEIWKRVTQQKNAQESFRNTLKEVYELNKCPSLQESIKYAIEDDCSVMKRAFLRCTAGAGITKEVPVDEAQPLIAEAVKKLRIKPIFYDGYIRKKIDIAKPIGVITENAQESIRDTLKEDHNLNECPSLQDSITYAIEDDCSVMERAFLCCTAGAGVPKEVSEDKAQELIAEAV